MSLVIDANMKLFSEMMHISSSRMIQDYGLSTVDEIIEAEAERGNTHALKHAAEYYSSPAKLIDLFELTDVENRFVLISKMDNSTRMEILPLLFKEDLVMGLYFFTKEGLLEMLMKTDIEELVQVALEAFSLEHIVMMFTEEDLMKFMLHDDLEKKDVMEQLKVMPPEVMQKFIEGVTGKPIEETNQDDFFRMLDNMQDDEFKKFMAVVDPDVQRQVTYQLTQQNPDYLTLFSNEAYVKMLQMLQKPDMIKPMIMLKKDTLINMISELPENLMSIVAAQVDTKEFAKFLQDGHMDLIEDAWMI